MTHDEIMAMTDEQLDYAAAVAQEWVKSGIVIPCWVNQNKYVIDVSDYHPSSNGQQLLEIMNREKIGVEPCTIDLWVAETTDESECFVSAIGTINQAVLHCYLLSKQGGKNG